MFNSMDIKEHMEVVGSDGAHVGTVDRVEGQHLKLTKTDSPDGQHHYLATDMIDSVGGGVVKLSLPADVAKSEMMGAPSSGMGDL